MELRFLAFVILFAIAIFFAFALGVAAAAPSPAPKAVADSCGPSYLEIYDFKIGDVFQYSRLFASNAGRRSFDAKYTVLAKEAFPDGFRYQVSGLTKTFSYPALPRDGYGQTSETWEFRDSLPHRSLDGCRNEVVRFPQSGPEAISFGPSGEYYTRIGIWPCDTLDFGLSTCSDKLKVFGALKGSRPINVYSDTLGTSAPIIELFAAYARGLGMVRKEFDFLEGQESLRLKGFIRNGRTFGVVDPDDFFRVTVALGSRPAAGKASPPIFSLSPSGRFWLSADGDARADGLGRRSPPATDRVSP